MTSKHICDICEPASLAREIVERVVATYGEDFWRSHDRRIVVAVMGEAAVASATMAIPNEQIPGALLLAAYGAAQAGVTPAEIARLRALLAQIDEVLAARESPA